MKLYIKQKVFSIKDKFTVTDENGENVYQVEGKFFSLGKKITVYDMMGNEKAFIHQKVLSFLPKFYVQINGEDKAEIVKKFTFLKPKYVVNGPGWDIEGDFWAHDYNIVKNGEVIVSIHKKWMSWGDTFELIINDKEDTVFALGVVLAIDACMDAAAAAAASSASN